MKLRNERTLRGLSDLCRCLRPKSLIVEIGSFAGESAAVFLDHGHDLICIDPWTDESATKLYAGHALGFQGDFPRSMAEIEAEFDRRCIRTERAGNLVAKLKGPDRQFAWLFNQIDVVYIDSIHTYESTRDTIARWAPKVRYFVAGHDYGRDFPGVCKAVDEYVARTEGSIKTFSDTSWLV